MMHGTMKIKF